MYYDKTLVSIIVPIYNAEKYLAKCIESILHQTYKNLEVILIDDGSSDNSRIIADRYAQKDQRIKIIHKENSGVSNTRNIGIKTATGDYVCFSDADDWLQEDYVEYLLKLAQDNDADISITTEMYTNYYIKQTQKDNIKIFSPESATSEILHYNLPIGVYCKLFKRDFIINNKIKFLSNFFVGEGFNFNTTAFQRANKIIAGHKRIYYYRRDNSESAMTKFNINKILNALDAIANIKKNFIIHSTKIIRAWEYANWHTNCDMYFFITMSNKEKDYPDIYHKCLKITKIKAFYAFLVPIRFRERAKAPIMIFCPRLMVKMLMMRRQGKLFLKK